MNQIRQKARTIDNSMNAIFFMSALSFGRLLHLIFVFS